MESMTEWAMRHGTAYRAHMLTSDHDPSHGHDTAAFMVIYHDHPTTGHRAVIIPDGMNLVQDAQRAVYLVDNGERVVPFYVAGWHPDDGHLILHEFPTDYDGSGNRVRRTDNGRPADYSTWRLAPRRAYHVKVTEIINYGGSQTCQGCPTENGPVYPAGRDGHAPDCTECPAHCQCDNRRRAMFAGPDV